MTRKLGTYKRLWLTLFLLSLIKNTDKSLIKIKSYVLLIFIRSVLIGAQFNGRDASYHNAGATTDKKLDEYRNWQDVGNYMHECDK